MQNTRMLSSVLEWQEKIGTSSTRKRKREITIMEEKKVARKVEREEKRREAIESVSNQDPTKTIPAPRQRILIDLMKEGN